MRPEIMQLQLLAIAFGMLGAASSTPIQARHTLSVQDIDTVLAPSQPLANSPPSKRAQAPETKNSQPDFNSLLAFQPEKWTAERSTLAGPLVQSVEPTLPAIGQEEHSLGKRGLPLYGTKAWYRMQAKYERSHFEEYRAAEAEALAGQSGEAMQRLAQIIQSSRSAQGGSSRTSGRRRPNRMGQS